MMAATQVLEVRVLNIYGQAWILNTRTPPVATLMLLLDSSQKVTQQNYDTLEELGISDNGVLTLVKRIELLIAKARASACVTRTMDFRSREQFLATIESCAWQPRTNHRCGGDPD